MPMKKYAVLTRTSIEGKVYEAGSIVEIEEKEAKLYGSLSDSKEQIANYANEYQSKPVKIGEAKE